MTRERLWWLAIGVAIGVFFSSLFWITRSYMQVGSLWRVAPAIAQQAPRVAPQAPVARVEPPAPPAPAQRQNTQFYLPPKGEKCVHEETETYPHVNHTRYKCRHADGSEVEYDCPVNPEMWVGAPLPSSDCPKPAVMPEVPLVLRLKMPSPTPAAPTATPDDNRWPHCLANLSDSNGAYRRFDCTHYDGSIDVFDCPFLQELKMSYNYTLPDSCTFVKKR
jgi:hypothetical protein